MPKFVEIGPWGFKLERPMRRFINPEKVTDITIHGPKVPLKPEETPTDTKCHKVYYGLQIADVNGGAVEVVTVHPSSESALAEVHRVMNNDFAN